MVSSAVFLTSIGASFLSGLIIFLLPCTYPLISGYIAILGSSKTPRTTIRNTTAFLIGFSLVAILFFTILNSLIAPYRTVVTQIGGIITILFGLSIMNMVALPAFLKKNVAVSLPRSLVQSEMTVLKSIIVGSIFALAWTPCIGPILASILLLATTGETTLLGILLLTFFFIGLSLPFLIVGYIYSTALKIPVLSPRFFKVVNRVGGVLLIIIGILLLTQNASIFEVYGYAVLDSFQWIIRLEEKFSAVFVNFL